MNLTTTTLRAIRLGYEEQIINKQKELETFVLKRMPADELKGTEKGFLSLFEVSPALDLYIQLFFLSISDEPVTF